MHASPKIVFWDVAEIKRFIFPTVLFVLGIGEVHPQNGVLMRCGASNGYSYFLGESSASNSGWAEDGMRNGNILLVGLAEEWDIQFGDALGAYGYRQDGAMVLPLLVSEDFYTVGAFHSNYVDIYTFDILNHQVGWTSNKVGPIAPKVSAMIAQCK